MDLLLPWLLFEAELKRKEIWVYPPFRHIHHPVGVAADPLDADQDDHA
jgi:hypothetical protein